MKRIIAALSIALTSAAVLIAQDIKSETTVKTDDDAKPVMLTGCLQTGTAANSFMLENAVAVKQETTTDADVNAAGMPEVTKTTTTTYALVPGGTIEFQQNVGQKVEVTGILIPAGDDEATIKTEEKVEVEGGQDRQVETEQKIDQGDAPQLRVVSIKHLSDRCTATP